MPKLIQCPHCIHKAVCINDANNKVSNECKHYIHEGTILKLREELFNVRQNSVHISTVKMLLQEKMTENEYQKSDKIN